MWILINSPCKDVLALRMNYNVIRAMRIIHEASPALRIEKQKYSVIAKHLKDERNRRPNNLHEQFAIHRKCRGRLECLIYKMLLKRKKKPTLNTKKDSIQAKLFFNYILFSCFFLSILSILLLSITFHQMLMNLHTLLSLIITLLN